jgi:uncharacterized protein (TIGR02300 family)
LKIFPFILTVGGDPVARPELGLKRACQACGTKFYDLHKNPIICPKCSAVFVVTAAVAARGAAEAGRLKSTDDSALPDTDDVELVSLQDADDEASGKIKGLPDDDIELDDDALGGDDDVFLEDDEEGTGDVSDLIGGDLDDDEEA